MSDRCNRERLQQLPLPELIDTFAEVMHDVPFYSILLDPREADITWGAYGLRLNHTDTHPWLRPYTHQHWYLYARRGRPATLDLIIDPAANDGLRRILLYDKGRIAHTGWEPAFRDRLIDIIEKERAVVDLHAALEAQAARHQMLREANALAKIFQPAAV